jgi:hypothetical protein
MLPEKSFCVAIKKEKEKLHNNHGSTFLVYERNVKSQKSLTESSSDGTIVTNIRKKYTFGNNDEILGRKTFLLKKEKN